MQGLIAFSVALAQPSTEELTSAWQALAVEMEAAELPVPVLSADDFAQIAAGETVAHRMKEQSGIDRVVGVAWMAQSQDEAWVAFHDDAHFESVSSLVEEQLQGTRPQRKILYQHADLPLPLSDRHWVIVIENNLALYRASGGRLWERTWTLDERGTGALDDVPPGMCGSDSAVWTPFNEGGYWLLPAGSGSLMVYQVRFDAGGFIPDELVVRGTLMKMEEMMQGIDDRADELPVHYVHGHTIVERPDGTQVPAF